MRHSLLVGWPECHTMGTAEGAAGGDEMYSQMSRG